MSLQKYEDALRVEPQQSLILKWFLIANFSGATLLLLISLPPPLALLVVALLWGYFYRLYNRHILQRSGHSIRLLVREQHGEWVLRTNDDIRHGAEQEMTISPSSYLHPYFILLILQAGRNRYTLPLLPDSLSANCFRALSVRLKTEQVQERSVTR